MFVDSMKTGDDTLKKLTHLNMAVVCTTLEERNSSNQMEASAVIHDIPTLTFCGSCWHFNIHTTFVFTPENKTLNFQLLFITMQSVPTAHPSPSPTISFTSSLIHNPSLTPTSSLHRPPCILYSILYQGPPNQNIPGVQAVHNVKQYSSGTWNPWGTNGLTKGARSAHIRRGRVRGNGKEQRVGFGNRVDTAEGTQRMAKEDSLVSTR